MKETGASFDLVKTCASFYLKDISLVKELSYVCIQAQPLTMVKRKLWPGQKAQPLTHYTWNMFLSKDALWYTEEAQVLTKCQSATFDPLLDRNGSSEYILSNTTVEKLKRRVWLGWRQVWLTGFFGATFIYSGVSFIFIKRIRPGRTQVVQDELVNHG